MVQPVQGLTGLTRLNFCWCCGAPRPSGNSSYKLCLVACVDQIDNNQLIVCCHMPFAGATHSGAPLPTPAGQTKFRSEGRSPTIRNFGRKAGT